MLPPDVSWLFLLCRPSRNDRFRCRKVLPGTARKEHLSPRKIESQHHDASSSGDAGGLKTRPVPILPTPSSDCQKTLPLAAERVASMLWDKRDVISTEHGNPLHPHISTSSALRQSSKAIVLNWVQQVEPPPQAWAMTSFEVYLRITSGVSPLLFGSNVMIIYEGEPHTGAPLFPFG